MTRSVERLSARKCSTVKPKHRRALMLCDGGGLYLQVSIGPNATVRRSWIFRYQRPGQPVRDMGLGSFHDVGLADARDLARQNRKLVKDGLDPIVQRDARIAKNIANSASVITFKDAAETFIRQHRSTWKNIAHARQWPQTLQDYAYPTLARMSVADVETAHVMKVLNPIWQDKVETAKRLRGRIEQILGWATASGYRKDQHGHDRPNPARWRGHLDKLLAAPTKVREVKHQAALPYDDMADFMVKLRARNGVGSLALEFLILTCVRTADVRRGQWDQIDRAAKVWVIPKFSKTGREHRVPLCRQALAVLDKVRGITKAIEGRVAQSEFIFPNDRTGKALSENALLAVIERAGLKGKVTSHGFRSSFRDWAREQTNFPRELSEMSLGHMVGSKVERAYARGDALQKRFRIIQAWADFCGQPVVDRGEVVPMQERA
jgi:integrase